MSPQPSPGFGFHGLVELLKTAKHGRGRRVFLVEFRYVKPGSRRRRPDTRLELPFAGPLAEGQEWMGSDSC